MDNESGYSLQEAGRRLDCSAATVRRELERDPPRRVYGLMPLEGSDTLMVSKESLDRAVAAKLGRMGVIVADDTSRRTALLQMEALRSDLSIARRALADLSDAHTALLKTHIRLSHDDELDQ